ncbi:MAG TPA: hypothetical protein VEP50_11070 [bacterium]|nr:hypothetical protein [bacterium]
MHNWRTVWRLTRLGPRLLVGGIGEGVALGVCGGAAADAQLPQPR